MTKKIIGKMSIDLIKGEFTPKFYLVDEGERMNDRFMIDDCGTLIDMETRKSYDYVSEILPLLNQLNNENKIFENVKNKRDWDVINMEEPRKQSVSYRGVPCTARTCVTNLNRLTEENQQYKILVKELKKQNKKLKARLNDLGVEYYD